jgi:Ca2+-transporting ATPase
MNDFGQKLGWIILAICGMVVVVGTVAQNNFTIDIFIQMLIVGVALAVAAIPEGLPAVITVALSIGVIRMSKQNAIVRKLDSVETLGSTTVICTDKTGTLTQNRMTVEKVLISPFDTPEIINYNSSKTELFKSGSYPILFTTASLCNNSKTNSSEKNNEILGEPTEVALLSVSRFAGYQKNELENSNKRIYEFPFDSERKLMSTINKISTSNGIVYRLFVKGAPDVVRSLCSNVITNNNSVQPFTNDFAKKIELNEKSFGTEALRVLAFAYKDIPESEIKEIMNIKELDYHKYESNLTFIGIMGMKDPPRPEAIAAIKTANLAGIRVIMITGDHKNTAIAIGKQMGLLQKDDDHLVMTGKEISGISEEDLIEKVRFVKIFARVNPEHKLQIVSALQKNNEIVAVTGDGVNDAPALKQADIGVAMGLGGTDVAKQASDMVLIDDNFATLESAIEEGRGIYANMKKFISYLLACNTGEVLTIFIGIIVLTLFARGYPLEELLPLTALQILYVNLLTDGLPALALGVDPKEPNVMKENPRDPNESIFNIHMSSSILLAGSIVGFGTLILFFLNLDLSLTYAEWVIHADGKVIGGTIIKAQTMAFTVLIFFQKAMAFSSRSEKDSLFKVGIFTNKYLWGAILFTTFIHLWVIYYEPLQRIFGTTALSLEEWLIILSMSLTVFIAEEIRKFIFRHKNFG